MCPWATDAPAHRKLGSNRSQTCLRAQEVGVQQVPNLLRTYSTSYQTTLQSFKSFAFTVPEKSLMKVHTDGRTDMSKT